MQTVNYTCRCGGGMFQVSEDSAVDGEVSVTVVCTACNQAYTRKELREVPNDDRVALTTAQLDALRKDDAERHRTDPRSGGTRPGNRSAW